MRYSLPKFAPDSFKKKNRERIYFCDRLNFI